LLITFKTMHKIRLHAALYHYYLLFVLMAAIAISGGRDFLFTKDAVEVKVGLPEIQEIYPAATLFEMNRFGVYEVYAASGQQIGTALLSSNYSQQFGYAGIVPLLTILDEKPFIIEHHKSVFRDFNLEKDEVAVSSESSFVYYRKKKGC
jgi:NosR/NirI family transcriptional regulator, nitrous oxide reductase regulator